jgi:hypothetical protein
MICFANYQFSNPECLLNWTTSEKSGIYAILVQDPTSKSKPYKALFSNDFSSCSKQIRESRAYTRCPFQKDPMFENLSPIVLLLQH